MKKLLAFVMIGFFAVSCQPAELTCDCSGTAEGLSLIDTNLIGHWKLTNVNNQSYPNQAGLYNWNDGQIDLHFFANGTLHLDFANGNGVMDYIDGSYLVHSNNSIKLGSKVFNYAINNSVLTFSAVPGQDYIWIMDGTGRTTFINSATLNSADWAEYTEVNNLTKQ